MASKPLTNNLLAYTFICEACGRLENTRSWVAPADWAVIAQELERSVVHCPDCAAKPEQACFIGLDTSSTADEMVMSFHGVRVPGQRLFMNYESAVRAAADPAFGLHLTRQLDGSYLISMAPVKVLTLFQPMGFVLDADDAELLAADLQHHAALVRNPGTLGAVA